MAKNNKKNKRNKRNANEMAKPNNKEVTKPLLVSEHGLSYSPYKRVYSDGTVNLKVVNFPAPDGCEFSSESMWVTSLEGSDNEGIGRLLNQPFYCEEVKRGDLVEFGGGTDDRKPHYVRVVSDKPR